MSLSTIARHTSAWIALGTVLFASHDAFAQAWVGDRNNLGVSFDYVYARSDRVIFDFGDLVPEGDDIANHNVAIGVEYVPLERLGLQAVIPIVSSVYTGAGAVFPSHGRYDDGNHHTVLQDFRFIARYMVLDGLAPVTLTPHLGFSVPMTDYETVGYAGAGRGLMAAHIGLNVGKYFASGPLTDLYVHGQYEFSLVEKYKTAFEETADIGQNRSDAKFLLGYFITEKLDINLAVDFRVTHGGLAFVDFEEAAPAVQHNHDSLIAEKFAFVGGGVSYQVMDKLRLSAIFRLWVWGENTRDSNMVGGGVSYDIM